MPFAVQSVMLLIASTTDSRVKFLPAALMPASKQHAVLPTRERLLGGRLADLLHRGEELLHLLVALGELEGHEVDEEVEAVEVAAEVLEVLRVVALGRPELHVVDAGRLQRLLEVDLTVQVHARGDEVDALVLHRLHDGGHVVGREAEREAACR